MRSGGKKNKRSLDKKRQWNRERKGDIKRGKSREKKKPG